MRRIFSMYLDGKGMPTIAKTLNEEGYTTKTGKPWQASSISYILTNEKYHGDLLLQKFYVKDYLTKCKRRNHGELEKHYVQDDHDAIVTQEEFDSVQAQRQKNIDRFYRGKGQTSVFTGKLRCAICGKNYRRKTTPNQIVWCCATYKTKGKTFCASKVIPETMLQEASARCLGLQEFDAAEFEQRVACIDVKPGNLLCFHFVNGRQEGIPWEDHSRSNSWTPEMREAARQHANKRWK